MSHLDIPPQIQNTTSTKIEAGLNPKIAINKVEGSWLSQHLSRDGVVAIISFCASLVVSLIAWLFKKMDDSPNS